jgi:hypothetical protein
VSFSGNVGQIIEANHNKDCGCLGAGNGEDAPIGLTVREPGDGEQPENVHRYQDFSQDRIFVVSCVAPDQWTPAACKVWREADPEDAWLLEAALAWELATGRQAQPADEDAVRERRRQMDAATAAAKTKAAD